MTPPRPGSARPDALDRLVPTSAPAFLRRFVLSEIFGPPLGRLPRRPSRGEAPTGPAAPGAEKAD